MAAKSDTQCSHWTGRLSPHLAHLAHLTHLGHLTHQPSASSHQLGVWLPGGLAGNLLRTKRTKSATTTNHSRRALPQFPRTKLPHIIISAEECPVICQPHWTLSRKLNNSSDTVYSPGRWVLNEHCSSKCSLLPDVQWVLIFPVLNDVQILTRYSQTHQKVPITCFFTSLNAATVGIDCFYNIDNICAAWHCIPSILVCIGWCGLVWEVMSIHTSIKYTSIQVHTYTSTYICI